MGAPISLWHCIPSSHFIRGKDTHGTDRAGVVSAALPAGRRGLTNAAAARSSHLRRDLMTEAAPVAAVSNEVAAVALVISALALGAQSPALR